MEQEKEEEKERKLLYKCKLSLFIYFLDDIFLPTLLAVVPCLHISFLCLYLIVYKYPCN